MRSYVRLIALVFRKPLLFQDQNIGMDLKHMWIKNGR